MPATFGEADGIRKIALAGWLTQAMDYFPWLLFSLHAVPQLLNQE
jgi:hypothetical protein